MKVLSLFPFLLFSIQLTAQKKYVGNYHTYFGNRIEIYHDSTFKYIFNLDTESSWTKGTWKVHSDTIYFKMIPIYDTVVYKDSAETLRIDSLVLSSDQTPERISSLESISGFLSSYGQNRHPFPDKLFFSNDKLFYIQGGKLVRQRMKGFWTTKKYVPWYIKESKS